MCRAIYVVVILSVLIGFVLSKSQVTPSEQCPGQNFENLRERIQVIPCFKTQCKLRKNTNVTVTVKFSPEHEIQELLIEANADVGNLGIPLPFIGIDGTSACAQVRRADTGAPSPCPLLPGQEYVYTNVFPIQEFYPEVGLRVHWALRDTTTNKDAICFELPAIIAKAKA